jgi:hypothetical protein
LLYTGQMSWEWLHSELEMFRRKKSQPSLQLKHVRAITGRLDLHCVTCEVAHRPRERVQSKQSQSQWSDFDWQIELSSEGSTEMFISGVSQAEHGSSHL